MKSLRVSVDSTMKFSGGSCLVSSMKWLLLGICQFGLLVPWHGYLGSLDIWLETYNLGSIIMLEISRLNLVGQERFFIG
jgi:hypothetical protein